MKIIYRLALVLFCICYYTPASILVLLIAIIGYPTCLYLWITTGEEDKHADFVHFLIEKVVCLPFKDI